MYTIWVIFFAVYGCYGEQKRLVLHSDVDVVHELNILKSELMNVTTKLNFMESKLATKDKEIEILQQNFTAELKSQKVALEADITSRINHEDKGSTYVRWGRTICNGTGTQSVYHGYTGGSDYTETGGAANFVCLPEHPKWAQVLNGLQGSPRAHMKGTEYNADTYLNQFNPFNLPADQHDDAPCVVCRARYSTTIMIPAMTTCSPGWDMQYTGYLMAGRHGLASATEFICVDGNPETELHGEDYKLGRLLYFVETVCGSLPCQSYPSGKELACVVCSK